MTNDEKLMQQALEALQNLQGLCSDADDGFIEEITIWTPEIITALNNRLAQPEQEPVGKFAKFTDGIWREVTDGSAGVPLYATPPQRKPLSDEEALDIARTFGAQPWPPGSCVAFARAIEAAHGIKENT